MWACVHAFQCQCLIVSANAIVNINISLNVNLNVYINVNVRSISGAVAPAAQEYLHGRDRRSRRAVGRFSDKMVVLKVTVQ